MVVDQVCLYIVSLHYFSAYFYQKNGLWHFVHSDTDTNNFVER